MGVEKLRINKTTELETDGSYIGVPNYTEVTETKTGHDQLSERVLKLEDNLGDQLSNLDREPINELRVAEETLPQQPEVAIAESGAETHAEVEHFYDKIKTAVFQDPRVVASAKDGDPKQLGVVYRRVYDELLESPAYNLEWKNLVEKYPKIVQLFEEHEKSKKEAALQHTDDEKDSYIVKEDEHPYQNIHTNPTVAEVSTSVRPATYYPLGNSQEEPVKTSEVGNEGFTRATHQINFLNSRHRTSSDKPQRTNGNTLEVRHTTELEIEYEKVLGISYEQLQSVEGFTELSEGQKRMVFENLSQLTYGNVQEEAARLHKESTQTKREKLTGRFQSLLGNGEKRNKLSRALAGAITGFKNAFTKEAQLAQHQVEALEKIRRGGDIETLQAGENDRLKLFTQLVESAREYGPQVYENAAGELVIDLINLREYASETENNETWFALSELNKSADEFARIPIEWRGDTLGIDNSTSKIESFLNTHVGNSDQKEHAAIYGAAMEKYENQRKAVEERLRADGKTDIEISKLLTTTDTRVTQLQTLRTNPDAVAELTAIDTIDPKKVAATNLLKGGRIGYLAFGSVARSVLGPSLGLAAAPIVALATGSLSSWKRSAAEIRERDRNARRGVKDESGDALNIVSAEALSKKIFNKVVQCQNATGEQKLKQLASLRARIEYTNDKQKLNRIDYGDPKQLVSNQTTLARALGEALSYLAIEESAEQEAVRERMEQTDKRLQSRLERFDVSIDEIRRAKRKYQAASDGAKAALAAVGGALAADFIIEQLQGVTDGIITSVTEASVFPPIETEVSVPAVEAITSEKIATTVPENLPTVPEDELPFTFDDYLENTEPDTTAETLSEDIFSDGPTAEVTESTTPDPEYIESNESLGTYEIKKNDTLTKIMSEQIPAISDLDPNIQDTVMANIFNDLSPKELEAIGLTSGNVDLIYAGSDINLDALAEIVESKRHLISRALERVSH